MGQSNITSNFGMQALEAVRQIYMLYPEVEEKVDSFGLILPHHNKRFISKANDIECRYFVTVL
ncbi:hypothetical protein CVD25_10455 [Bacillus canaveralius]|uniref:Uncharacterized protein n=1 Tax=Bacillus canaveralius TaxID=1403243 RepID=A0A2N5GM61_9BACI|nr:hypothetical protein [Bacillus canaveralius]PLR82946.1 hypothetical protein CU635_10740 [Bacillus canaveralius]PLR97049.1 hypothetical protein CVD25_10455 [Bacillus canaveralius]